MPTFIYTAKDRNGRTVKGEMQVPDKKHALSILHGKQLLILKLREAKDTPSLFSSLRLPGRKKVKMDELVIFTRQLATMTGAGITIVNSLDTLADQEDNAIFK
ncbi:type II secretion system F family protein, partial [Candidatus Omnitrophota bacterium]